MKSSSKPTQKLVTAMQVAETLDAYVQPRFEILRDKNFGAFRIIYPKHAGIGQLKVDTLQEKKLIANINATKRDYAISLLHCSPKPNHPSDFSNSNLELLYLNQRKIVSDMDFYQRNLDFSVQEQLGWQMLEKIASSALPRLKAGKEYGTINEN